MNATVAVQGVVEGDVDAAVFRKLITDCGAVPGTAFGLQGKHFVHNSIRGYDAAAKRSHWFVLVDLNGDYPCAPDLIRDWLPHPSKFMCFRVAVRELEAWLMADKVGMAGLLQVAMARLPHNPDAVASPKQELVNLARRSRSPRVRYDMVPRPAGGRQVGPGYNPRLIAFVQNRWNVSAAMEVSDSLRRCVNSLERLIDTAP